MCAGPVEPEWVVAEGGCGIDREGLVTCNTRDCSLDGCPPYLPPPDTFVQLSGGDATCGLLRDRTVRCFDANGSRAPVPGEFLQVSTSMLDRYRSGLASACGVRVDGSLVCWGEGVLATTPPPEGRFTEVQVGLVHACARAVDGALTCWGHDILGASVPPTTRRYRGVAVGRHSGCAIREDGGLDCFGDVLNGDRGFEGVVDVVDVDVGWAGNACWVTGAGELGCTNDRPPSDTFESVSVGWRHQCGITTDHALRCWSSHATFDGGCYAGPGACGRDPLPIEGRFVEVSAGAQHTCARSEDGEVLCFGARDTAAWLSNPTESLTNLDTEPSGGVQGWSCGLNAEGFARCWGAREVEVPSESLTSLTVGRGVCGLREDGTLACSTAFPAPAGTFVDVSLSATFACGVRTGGVLTCWGGMRR
ncbi:MAG: hypothetical protein H6721_13655 [Sandaracinus sp.]|nr:hypothetical protein [Sandaracinus sp.]